MAQFTLKTLLLAVACVASVFALWNVSTMAAEPLVPVLLSLGMFATGIGVIFGRLWAAISVLLLLVILCGIGKVREPVMRGGSWRSGAFHCTTVAHDPGPAGLRADNIGFRVTCTIEAATIKAATTKGTTH